MNHLQADQNMTPLDPLIDETGENRRALVDEFGSDLDRLAEHLRQVQTAYESRSGQFANLPSEANDELFPRMTQRTQDQMIDEVRHMRVGTLRKQK